jgi:peptidyl-tRNA hydrolase, PTH1 family
METTEPASEPAPAKVLIGLGNPGPKFLWTRHNLGFDVMERLAATHGAPFSQDDEFNALIARPNPGIVIVKPQTGMNDSGLCVRALVEKLDVSLADVMLVYDDISMPLGRLRFATKGSAGGHHGIESTLFHLQGKSNFPRLKVAVGPDVRGDLRKAFLLSPIEEDARKLYLQVVSIAAEACQLWLATSVDVCMSRYNGLDLARQSAT